jgi:hypothetical protein
MVLWFYRWPSSFAKLEAAYCSAGKLMFSTNSMKLASRKAVDILLPFLKATAMIDPMKE